jgi:uncharacterized protein (TIGR03083 family)
MTNALDALELSVDHLHATIDSLSEDQYVASAYPTEWTVADVMSHLGSGAIITKRNIDDTVEGREPPPKFNESVWDVWNAKTPHAQVTDALDADRALLTRMLELTPEERDRYFLNLGPMKFNFDQAVRLRLGEHVFHTWDIQEVSDAHATLLPEAVPFLFGNLELLMRFAVKPSGHEHTLHIRTTDPQKDFALTQTSDTVTLEEVEGVTEFELELPAEAFLRLAYGRLDEMHTPPGVDATHLGELRRVFPGL